MQNKKTVCVDLDGTLAQYDTWKGIDHIGEPIEGAKEFLDRLAENYKIIIWTTRCNIIQNRPQIEKQLGYGLTYQEASEYLEANIADWLNNNNMKFDEVWMQQGKPMCHAFIDDRAMSCRPQEDQFAYSSILHKLNYLK